MATQPDITHPINSTCFSMYGVRYIVTIKELCKDKRGFTARTHLLAREKLLVDAVYAFEFGPFSVSMSKSVGKQFVLSHNV